MDDYRHYLTTYTNTYLHKLLKRNVYIYDEENIRSTIQSYCSEIHRYMVSEVLLLYLHQPLGVFLIRYNANSLENLHMKYAILKAFPHYFSIPYSFSYLMQYIQRIKSLSFQECLQSFSIYQTYLMIKRISLPKEIQRIIIEYI